MSSTVLGRSRLQCIHGGEGITVTIVEIGDGWFKNNKLLLVATDAFDQMIENNNEILWIVSSKSKAAPPKGEWKSVRNVNLVRRELSPKEK